MKIKLHHVNLCSTNVTAMDEFYRGVLDMEPESSLAANRDLSGGYPGKVAFLSDGATQFHLAEKDLGVGFRTGQAVNPVERGHIAFRTDDIDAFKKPEGQGHPLLRLRRLGHERLGADLLLRPRRQHHRGAPSAGVMGEGSRLPTATPPLERTDRGW
jgi:glyoxylase I family protein